MNVGQQENGTGGVWCQLLREDLQYKKPHLLVDAVGVQYHVAAVSHLGGVSTKGEGHGERPAPPQRSFRFQCLCDVIMDDFDLPLVLHKMLSLKCVFTVTIRLYFISSGSIPADYWGLSLYYLLIKEG